MRAPLELTACLGLMAAAVAHAQAPDTPRTAIADTAPASGATELDPVVIRPPPTNLLDESRERLLRMMEESPCLGCGPEQDQARISIYTKTYYGVGAVLSFLSGMPEHPPEATPAERTEARVVNDWRRAERAPAEVE